MLRGKAKLDCRFRRGTGGQSRQRQVLSPLSVCGMQTIQRRMGRLLVSNDKQNCLDTRTSDNLKVRVCM